MSSDQKVLFSLKSHPCDASPPLKCKSCRTYFHKTTFPDGYTTQKMLLKWKKGFDQSKVGHVSLIFHQFNQHLENPFQFETH